VHVSLIRSLIPYMQPCGVAVRHLLQHVARAGGRHSGELVGRVADQARDQACGAAGRALAAPMMRLARAGALLSGSWSCSMWPFSCKASAGNAFYDEKC